MKNLLTIVLTACIIQSYAQNDFYELSEDGSNEAVHFDNSFFLQRSFESENAWTRGNISQGILWNKSLNEWEINRALKSNNDFSLIKFSNSGNLSFYTRTTTGSGAYTLTNAELSDYNRMKIHADGHVEVMRSLGVGAVPDNNYRLHITMPNQNLMKLTNTNPSGGNGSIAYHNNVGVVSRIQFKSDGTLNFQKYNGSGYNSTFQIEGNGNVGIGTTSLNHKLEVNGTIRSKEVKVEASPWPDYVFEADYNLRTLEETEAYIKSNKHLPEIPSAEEMETNGVQLGEMNMLLLKKIEELTLHTIQQQKLIEAQGKMIEELKRN